MATNEPKTECWLQQLPIELTTRMWPAQRALMAGRTSTWLRGVLPRLPCASLLGNPVASEDEFTPESVARTLCLFGGCVEVEWVGPRGRQLLRGIAKARTEGFAGAITSLILEGSWMQGADIGLSTETDASDEREGDQLSDVAHLLAKTLSFCSPHLVRLHMELNVPDIAADDHPFRPLNGPEPEVDFLAQLSNCSWLRDLRLSGKWLGREFERRTVLPPHILGALTHLEISRVGVHEPFDDGFSALVELMPETCSLETLNVCGNGLGYHHFDYKLKIGQKCPALRCLNMGGALLGSGAGELVRSIACCNNLTELNLSDNWMHDGGAQALAGSIGSLPQLRVLDLSDQQLGSPPDQEAMDDAERTELWLAGSLNPGMAALAGTLALHPSLQTLDLRDNAFDASRLETVGRQLARVPTLRV